MRILLVIPGLNAGGGSEHSLAATAAAMAATGAEVHLALFRDRRALTPELARQGVVVHDLSGSSGVRLVRSLRRLAADLEPDVVHATLFDASVPAQLALLGTGTPILVTWANTPVTAAEGRRGWGGQAKHGAATLVEQGLGRLTATQYHAVTGGVARAQAARGRVPARLVHVGERGRDAHRFLAPPGAAEALGRELGIPAGAPVVVAVGRQEPQKGYGSLLRAFARVADAVPEAWLVVAGREGSDTEALRRLQASLPACERVCFLGQRDDVAAVLARADVIVCSSWREGAAGALIEAMAAGVPIVSVALDGLADVLVDGENALIVSREDLGPGVLRVLGDPELARRLAEGGRTTFDRRFTLAQATARMLEIYAEVAG